MSTMTTLLIVGVLAVGAIFVLPQLSTYFQGIGAILQSKANYAYPQSYYAIANGGYGY